MKNNILTKLLTDWENLSEQERFDGLQEMENFVARTYGRKPRTIVNVDEQSHDDLFSDNDVACFNNKYPNYIINNYIEKIDNPTDAILFLIHEGIHAYIYDYFSGKCNLRIYSNINSKKLNEEHSHLDELFSFFEDENFKGFRSLFDLKYYEEVVAHQESARCLAKMLFDSAESKQDFSQIYNPFILCLTRFYNLSEEAQKLERQLGYTYDEIYKKIVQQKGKSVSTQNSSRKVITFDEKSFNDFFNNSLNLYTQIANSSSALQVKPSEEQNILLSQLQQGIINFIGNAKTKK